ncbi:MAG: hypothetical protein HGB19_00620 [Chlorobiales bacterium]|nr:hypothetical protein [Chlorobiales bacterium]
MSATILKTRGFLLILLGLLMSLSACSSEEPIDSLKRSLDKYPEYSIVLNDMKEEGDLLTDYYHRYKLVYGEPVQGKPDSVFYKTEFTDWQQVPESYYKDNANYLGMVLASKTRDGKISDDKFPPGYQYVGDQRYGQWRQNSDGTSFWEFYGKYALMSQVFGLLSGSVNRNDWGMYNDYRTRRQPYFGTSGQYGTFGSSTQKSNPSFFERRQVKQQASRSNFLNKFKTRVSRGSTSPARSRSFGGFGK